MDDEKPIAPPSVRDHLANERTLLAWIRTSLTIVGLGFIIDRLVVESAPDGGLADIAGVGLVMLGGIVALAGGYSFLNARRELATGTYRSQVGLHITLVGIMVLGAIALAAYLVST